MTVLATLQAAQTPVLLLLTIFGPSLLPRLIGYATGKRPRQTQPQPPRPPIPLAVKLVLLAYTVYGLKQLVFPPYDVFGNNGLPIMVNNDVLRRAVLGTESGYDRLHPATRGHDGELALLLAKLANLDNRYLYIRYGHEAFTGCEWCRDGTDYALASLAATMKPYLLLVLVLALLGNERIGGPQAAQRRDTWRGSFAWVIALLGAGEIGARYFWEIQAFNGDCLHLAGVIHTIRSIVLMVLPMAYTFLPLSNASTPPISILLAPLAQAQSLVRLTSITRSALSRSPVLRATVNGMAEQNGSMIRAARANPEVRGAAEQAGIREGPISHEAGPWIRSTWSSVVQITPK